MEQKPISVSRQTPRTRAPRKRLRATLEVERDMDEAEGLINLSFIIQTNGEIVPAMPDDEEFSPQQIRDYVAGPPEVVCQTHDGFFLFHNKEGKRRCI